ncbi:hypothetical protein DRN94_002195 [archaeon]|nr:hypothetical protein [archaeon]
MRNNSLSYTALSNILRQEVEKETLSQVSKQFYKQLTKLIAQVLTESPARGSDLQTALLRELKRRIVRVSKRILELRFQKLVNSVLEGRKVSISSLTLEERIIMYHLLQIRCLYNALSTAVEQGRWSAVLDESLKVLASPTTIRITREIPQFVDSRYGVLGPFKPGDVVSLPWEVAEELIERGLAAPTT